MLTVISPAKTLDFETKPIIDDHSQPAFLERSAALVARLRELAPDDLGQLMGVSAALAELNHRRFQNWATPFRPGNAKQAILAFRGDVYTGLDADRLSPDDFAFAQRHLRILSGLYGVLRPLDLIQPYRLEMGTRLVTGEGADLYAFWGDRLRTALEAELRAHAAPVLVNLASEEYFKAVQPNQLTVDVVTPVFKDRKGSGYKVVSFHAKKARGAMSAWMIRERITAPGELKAFSGMGYRFAPALSHGREWVFTRDAPE